MKSEIIDGELVVTFTKEEALSMLDISIAGFRHAENVIGSKGAEYSHFKEWKDAATSGKALFNIICEFKDELNNVL